MSEASVGSIDRLEPDSDVKGVADPRSTYDQSGVLQRCLSREKKQQFLTDTVVDSRRARLNRCVSLFSETQMVNSADGVAMEHSRNTSDSLLQGPAYKQLISHLAVVLNTPTAVKQTAPNLPIHRIIPWYGSLSSIFQDIVSSVHCHITKSPMGFQETSRSILCYVMDTGGPSHNNAASLSAELISDAHSLFNKTNSASGADPPPDVPFLKLCKPISYVEYTNKLSSFILHSSSRHCKDRDTLDKDNTNRTSIATTLQATADDLGSNIEPDNIVSAVTPPRSSDNRQTDLHRVSSHAPALQNLHSPLNYKKETRDKCDEDDLSVQTYHSVCSWLTSLSYDDVDSSPTDEPKRQYDLQVTAGHSDIALNRLIANTMTNIVTDIKNDQSDIALDRLIANTIERIVSDIKNDQSDIKLDGFIANSIATILSDIEKEDIQCSSVGSEQRAVKLDGFIANTIATIVSERQIKECRVSNGLPIPALSSNTIQSRSTGGPQSVVKLNGVANTIATIVADIQQDDGTMANGHLAALMVIPIQSGSGQSEPKLDGPIANNVSMAFPEIEVNDLPDMEGGSFTLDTWHEYVFSEMSLEKADSEYEGDDRMFQNILEQAQESHTGGNYEYVEYLAADTDDDTESLPDNSVGSALDRLSIDTDTMGTKLA